MSFSATTVLSLLSSCTIGVEGFGNESSRIGNGFGLKQESSMCSNNNILCNLVLLYVRKYLITTIPVVTVLVLFLGFSV